MVERLDMRGLECPIPTLKAIEAVKAARVGSRSLTIVLDDAVCAEEIPAQVGRWAYRAHVDRSADSEWTIRLEPNDAPGSGAAKRSKEADG